MGQTVSERTKPTGDGTLLLDVTVAVVTALALAGTGWLIHRELRRGGGQSGSAVQVAVAEQIVGSAKRRPGATLVWSRVDVGESLMRGDGVFVADDSALELLFSDGTRLSVSESSLVVVDLPEAAAAAPRVDVRQGAVAGRAGGRGLTLDVHGSSVALERGAVANVSGGKDAVTRVSVEKGTARVRDAGGGDARVGASQATAVESGRVTEVRDLAVALAEPVAGARIYTTAESTDVELTWRGGPGVVEVADDPSFSGEVRRQEGAGRAAVTLAAGAYSWRVIDASGRPASATRSFTVVRDQPPALLFPAANAVVYLAAKESTTFAWSRVAGVARYQVQIAAARDFAEVAFSTEVDGGHLRFGERLPEGDYFWRVRSLAPERGESPWSAPRPFKLAVEPLPRAPELYDSEVEIRDGSSPEPEPPEVTPEPTPNEVEPAPQRHEKSPKPRKKRRKQGASLLYQLFIGGVAHAAAPSAAILLRWEAVPGVRRYVLEIAEDKQFENVVVREELTDNWFRWRTISKRSYWWRVKSIDVKGREGRFSSPRQVGAVLRPPKPNDPSPGARFTIGTRAPSVAFSCDDQRLASRFEWSIATDAAFTKVLVTKTTREPKWTWTPDGPGTFVWHVRVADASGSFTGYSESRTFEVTLAAPIGHARVREVLMTDPPPRVELAARPVATATAYDIQVATDPTFAEAEVTSTSKPRWVLEPEVAGVYWWRWRARHGSAHSPWGNALSLDVTLSPPVLTAPAADAQLSFRAQQASTTVAWSPVPGAAGYEVVVAAADSEAARVRVSAPPVEVPGLAAGSYTVSVHALRQSGPAVESESVAFERVALPPLGTPVVVEPAADAWIGTDAADAEVRFAWQEVSDAHGYLLEVAPEGGEWQRSSEPSAEAVRTSLARGVYRWRVRAVDDTGVPGGFSEPVRFRIAAPPPAAAEIDIEPVAADTPARVDILLRDAGGRPVNGVELQVSADRGSISDVQAVEMGHYLARYQPPSDMDAGDDTLAVTVAGLADFRAERSVHLGSGVDLMIGGSVGLVSNFEAVLSPTVQAEVGVRLPWLNRRILATVRGSYHQASTSVGAPRVTATQHSVPIGVGLKLEFPYWVVVPYGSAHLVIGVLVGRLEVSGQDDIVHTQIGLGGELGAGVAMGLGPGDLFVELRYVWVRPVGEDEVFELDGGGLVPVAGYRIEL